MTFQKGSRVKHPTLTDWGLGEVLETSYGDHVKVFFVGGGAKLISLEYAPLVQIEGAEASHPVLDNLSEASLTKKIKYQTLDQQVTKFLSLFPQGFQGDDYISTEREYKVAAHELARDILSKDNLDSCLARSDFDEIAKSALKVSNATNLIFPNEKMSLRDGLKDPEHVPLFAEALRNSLYGEESPESRFKAFASVLETIGAAKWTTASYFQFIVFPETQMFVKPKISQQAAAVCAFEINYKTRLNWLTYSSVLKLAHYLADAISELKPRDMIDIQSFMWCISPDRKSA